MKASSKKSFEYSLGPTGGVIMLQYGARLHYATPEALARLGKLRAVYTDFSLLGSEARILRGIPRGLLPKPVRRLLGRVLPDAIDPKVVRRYPLMGLRDRLALQGRLHRIRDSSYFDQRGLAANRFTSELVNRRFEGASMVYSYPCVGPHVLRAAHKMGLKIIYEAIGHPRDWLIEAEEMVRFGHAYPRGGEVYERNCQVFREELALADVVLAASEYSASGLVEFGVDKSKIRVVPYGIESRFFDTQPNPEVGRILFVGTVGYRKGLPYLAEAARILRKSHPSWEIRVVGPVDSVAMGRPEIEGLKLIGQVPRSEVKEEFLAADLFVFPTISDAFGIVLMEALAAGLPIVATTNCADAVQDGWNGFRVSPRDPLALVRGMEMVVSDRRMRIEMSHRSREMLRHFSLVEYRARLQAVIEELDPDEARGAHV